MSMLTKLKQFKDLRNQAKTLQNMLKDESVEVSEAGGKLKIKMDGNMSISSVELDQAWLNPSNKKDIEKAIKDGVDSSIKKIQRIMASKMKESGMKFPSLE